MKKLMRLLCAAMLLVSFAACTEKENLNNDTPSGDDTNNYSAMLLGRWQVLSMTVDGQEMTPEHMQLLFINGGSGLMDDGDPTHHNDFTWVVSGDTVSVRTDHHQFTFIIDSINATDCLYHSSYFEFVDGEAVTGDIRFHMTKIGDNPGGDPDRGDLGISMPEMVGNTSSSITVFAHVTGSVDQYLVQFPNYTCGIAWCPEYDGAPTMGNNVVNGNPDGIGNFEVTINGLHAGTNYNVVAWLKLTPDSEPIYGDWRTLGTQSGGDNPGGDTNWVTLDDIVLLSSTSVSVTVTGYFDSNPSGIGVVYNTTGEPTLSDQVYNAFDHMDTETFEYDETILGMTENPDHSRTVTVMISGLQPGTQYYFRGYMQFRDEIQTIYTGSLNVTTPTSKR